jgi:hypothetical protein
MTDMLAPGTREPYLLPPSARRLFTSDRHATVVTVNPDGTPQVSMVWIGLDGNDLVDDYRDLLRRRLAKKVPVTRVLAEIRQHGYSGSHNLLVLYINQGRADPERTTPSPRQFVAWLMSKPNNLSDHHRRHRDDLIASCPALTTMATRVREFAEMLTQLRGTNLLRRCSTRGRRCRSRFRCAWWGESDR